MPSIETTVKTYHSCRLLETETEELLRKKKLPRKDRQLLREARDTLRAFTASIEALDLDHAILPSV